MKREGSLGPFKSLAVWSVLSGALVLVSAPGAQAQSWQDEFDGAANADVDGAKWVHDIGYGAWGNNEAETYTAGNANSWTENGYLRIQGKSNLTSARIKSKGKVNFGQYGKMEGRMRGPMASGYWPAFWMLGSNIDTVPWPGCGEIDIMEHANANANVLGTIHWNNPGWVYYTAMNVNTSFGSWHNYGVTWNSSEIRWYVDNVDGGAANIAGSINSTEEFHRPFYALLNMAMGGDFVGGVTPSVFPGNFDIDWVRWFNSGAGGLQTANNTQIRAQHSGKCMDASSNGTANGTVVQQWGGGTNDDCNTTTNAQKWKFAATSGGYYKIMSSNNNSQVVQVAGSSTADQGKLQLQTYSGANNQQWLPTQVQNNAGTYYRFQNRNSGKCIDVNGWNTANGVQLEQYTCNNTTNQLFSLQ